VSPDQPLCGSNIPSELVSDYQVVVSKIKHKTVYRRAVARWYGGETEQGNTLNKETKFIGLMNAEK
jgi:hypothetical protein